MTNPDVPQQRDEPKLTLIRSISEHERAFWLAKRQALLLELRGIEDYLGMERSIETKREKRRHRQLAAS